MYNHTLCKSIRVTIACSKHRIDLVFGLDSKFHCFLYSLKIFFRRCNIFKNYFQKISPPENRLFAGKSEKVNFWREKVNFLRKTEWVFPYVGWCSPLCGLWCSHYVLGKQAAHMFFSWGQSPPAAGVWPQRWRLYQLTYCHRHPCLGARLPQGEAHLPGYCQEGAGSWIPHHRVRVRVRVWLIVLHRFRVVSARCTHCYSLVRPFLAICEVTFCWKKWKSHLLGGKYNPLEGKSLQKIMKKPKN